MKDLSEGKIKHSIPVCVQTPLFKLTDDWSCLNKHNWPGTVGVDGIKLTPFLVLFLKKKKKKPIVDV